MLSLLLWLLPSSILGVIGYGFLFLLTVCFISGSDAGNMSKDFSWQFRLAAALRTPVLVFIVVPMSFALWVYRTVRIWWRGSKLEDSKDGHEQRVKKVLDAVTNWHNAGRKQRMRTARPNWAAMSTKLGSNKGDAHRIDTSFLNHILDVNEEAMTITCEPGVNMGDITNLLIPRGLALLIQVEMESLTIGGLSMGLGMETNSHNVGWFQETVKEFEIVTGESPPRVRKVTKEDDPDLFYTLPHSVGTLGFLTSVTVQITRIKPYVRMHYIMTKSAKELCETMTKLSEAEDKAPQFLEATAYSQHTAVVQCGTMCDVTTDEERKMINPVNYWYKPFYFKHLQTLLEAGHETYDEILPLKHYYHRFTRSIFWEIEDMIPFSNHPLYRFFWGWLGAPEVSLLKLFQGPVIRKNSVYAHVVQESCMPVRRIEEGLQKFSEWWDIYPLLLFPLRTYDRGEHSGFLNPRGKNLCPNDGGKDWGIWVDLAAYGVPKQVRNGGTFDAKKTCREFDHWTCSIGGFICYYTDIFSTRKEYRKMFDHTLWDKMRKRLKCDDAFPEPWDKVKSEPGIVDLSEEEAAEKAEEKTNGHTNGSTNGHATSNGKTNGHGSHA